MRASEKRPAYRLRTMRFMPLSSGDGRDHMPLRWSFVAIFTTGTVKIFLRSTLSHPGVAKLQVAAATLLISFSLLGRASD
jgi:hypothetical protein